MSLQPDDPTGNPQQIPNNQQAPNTQQTDNPPLDPNTNTQQQQTDNNIQQEQAMPVVENDDILNYIEVQAQVNAPQIRQMQQMLFSQQVQDYLHLHDIMIQVVPCPPSTWLLIQVLDRVGRGSTTPPEVNFDNVTPNIPALIIPNPNPQNVYQPNYVQDAYTPLSIVIGHNFTILVAPLYNMPNIHNNCFANAVFQAWNHIDTQETPLRIENMLINLQDQQLHQNEICNQFFQILQNIGANEAIGDDDVVRHVINLYAAMGTPYQINDTGDSAEFFLTVLNHMDTVVSPHTPLGAQNRQQLNELLRQQNNVRNYFGLAVQQGQHQLFEIQFRLELGIPPHNNIPLDYLVRLNCLTGQMRLGCLSKYLVLTLAQQYNIAGGMLYNSVIVPPIIPNFALWLQGNDPQNRF